MPTKCQIYNLVIYVYKWLQTSIFNIEEEQVKEAGIEIKMAANAFDGQCIATLKNKHPWVEYAVHTQPKPNPTQNNKSNE